MTLPAKLSHPSAETSAPRLPEVFVVGAAKSGTTAIYTWLLAHPQVFVPRSIKETNFMAFEGGLPPLEGPGDRAGMGRTITSLADYLALYAERGDEPVAADVSPVYLKVPRAADRIAELAPDARIVIVLRNPIECVLSMFAMMRGFKREPCGTLLEAFHDTDRRLAAGWEWAWDYKRGYLFSAQVARYLERFKRTNIFIRRYELLAHQPGRFYRELTEFLGVPLIDVDAFNQRVNTAPSRLEMLRRKPAGRLLYHTARAASRVLPERLTAPLRQAYQTPAYTLSAYERGVLVDHFADDVEKLSRLLSWDLSDWLQADAGPRIHRLEIADSSADARSQPVTRRRAA
jgi:hypothetical protein